MILQDAIDRALPQLQAEAVGRMKSRCTIAAPAPRSEWPTGSDGMQTPAHRLLYDDHPCRLGTYVVSSTEARIGDAAEEVASRVLHIPHDSRVVDNAVASVTSGEWAGTFWRVVESTGADQKTALRLRVEQVAEPEGWGTWVSV